MQIQRLQLSGYKRLGLSLIDYLDFAPQSDTQIILGTNGCGKSSILSELIPATVSINDFYKGGYKVLEIAHNGHYYRLISEIDKKVSYSFYKDGEPLNETGTGAIQKTLIEQELGVDDQIGQLLDGHFSFSSLTPNKRRDLITQMSNQDFSYAFRVYKKVQSQLRDQQGAIRHVRKRIEQEQSKLAQRDDNTLQEQVKQLKEELQHLLQSYQKSSQSADALESELNRLLEEIDSVCERILTHPLPSIEGMVIDSSQKLYEAHSEAQANVESLRKLIDYHSEEYQRLEKLNAQVGGENVSKSPQAYRQELVDSINAFDQGSFQFRFDFDPRELVGQIDELYRQLCQILADLPDNSEGQYSQEKRASYQKALEGVQSKVNKIHSDRLSTQSRIRQIDQETQVICPKCEYSFKPGVGESERDQLIRTLAGLDADLKEQEKEAERLNELIRQIDEYQRQLESLRSLARSYPLARPLFEYLFENKRVLYSPSQHMPMIDRFVRELNQQAKIYETQAKLQAFDQAMEQNKVIESSQGESLYQRLYELDKKITELNSELRSALDRQQKLKEFVKVYEQREANYQTLESLLRQYNQTLKAHIDALRSETIQKTIDYHQSDLAQKESKLNHYQSLEAIIKDLEKSEKELGEELKLYQILADALSPTDGIIADQIYELIATIISQVNEIISEIYSYPLQVLPCKLDADELDFRFPVITHSEHSGAPDIAKASSGQREVIDFAFKVIALIYMGAQNYPLYFDELGRFQDEVHHSGIMDYLRKLMDFDQFPQLFLISHFAVGHGSFHHADVNVLNPTNVTLPQRYNERLTIE